MLFQDPATRLDELVRYLEAHHLRESPQGQQRLIQQFHDKVVREERAACAALAQSFDREGIDDIPTSRHIAASIRQQGEYETGYYRVVHLPETTGMQTLRATFDPLDETDFEEYWLFLATSGVHGSYTDLDDIEEAALRLYRIGGDCWDPDHDVACVCGAPEDDDNHCLVRPGGRFRITILAVKPRIVQVLYGTVYGQVADGDIDFLRSVVGRTLQGVASTQQGSRPASLSSRGGFLADLPIPYGAVRNEANGPVSGAAISLADLPERPLITAPAAQSLANIEEIDDQSFLRHVQDAHEELLSRGRTRATDAEDAFEEWTFVDGPPDQSSSDDDWYALHDRGYIRPEEVLTDAEQVARIREAEATLASFFEALREKGIRQEM